MEVYKFGGASVKDAASIKNAASVLTRTGPHPRLLLVISAMGKTTNLLEQITDACMAQQEHLPALLKQFEDYHTGICKELFPLAHPVFQTLNNLFAECQWAIEEALTGNYDYTYDQIVGYGELLSSAIFTAYLQLLGMPATLLDARDYIITDDTYREGKVQWEESETRIKKLAAHFPEGICVTQGFIGATSENHTTTLGREGSDYTAAIFAYGLHAVRMTIWKDVPGVLNADPRYFNHPQVLPHLSYQDTIELAYYGATVIHPKTLKPLQNRGIPFFVKSFHEPLAPGTAIDEKADEQHSPCFILKKNQVLLSIIPRDFSFIVEDNLSEMYALLSRFRIKVNMMQHSAVSFTICVDESSHVLTSFVEAMNEKYKILYNTGLELVSVRYYNRESISRIEQHISVLLEQRSRHTYQAVIRGRVKNL